MNVTIEQYNHTDDMSVTKLAGGGDGTYITVGELLHWLWCLESEIMQWWIMLWDGVLIFELLTNDVIASFFMLDLGHFTYTRRGIL